jgi:competence protein ComEA
VGRWKEHIAFNRRERYGVVVLCLLLLAVSLIRASWDRISPPKYPEVVFSQIFIEKDTISTNWQEENISHQKPAVQHTPTKDVNDYVSIDHYFDPNKLPLKGWELLGFSEKQALSLIKYRTVIGGFKCADDVGRSFVVSPEKLTELKPWMEFTSSQIESSSLDKPFEISTVSNIELNKADSLELLRIKGVGPYYAGAIVHLRNDLGGFTSYDQLMGLYAMDEKRLANIMDQTSIDISLVKVRNVNNISIDELKSHLYVDFNLARSIVRYREQHGDYESLDGLLKVQLMNDSILERIRPFFAVHD